MVERAMSLLAHLVPLSFANRQPGTSPWPVGESWRPEHLRGPFIGHSVYPSCAVDTWATGELLGMLW